MDNDTTLKYLASARQDLHSLGPWIISSAMASKPFFKWEESLQNNLRLLIRANHILHKHGLVDAFGHISLRYNSGATECYVIAAYDPGAPALVKSVSDFIIYRMSDSTPLVQGQENRKGYAERWIHGEIYKKYPAVNCVIHSHSDAVLPFMAAKVPVRPVFHMAGFLGANGPPTFDARTFYEKNPGVDQDMLIKSAALGLALARTFSLRSSETVDYPSLPDHPVVLQSKHGFTCVGTSIQNALYRAIYTQTNCKLLKEALELARGDIEKVDFLTESEARDCAVMNVKTEDKALRLWLREVEELPLYRTEEGEPANLRVGGLGV